MKKNGPGLVPLAAMYWRLAVTGHKEHTVFPIYTSTPFPSWSVFDFLRWILSACGFSLQSIATSPHARCFIASKQVIVGSVISPALKKPKKQTVAAAQSIKMSLSLWYGVQCSLILRNMAGVIGRWTFTLSGLFECSLCTPACTRRRRGIDENSRGSGRPIVICMCLIADRYTLMVWGANLSLVRCAVK